MNQKLPLILAIGMAITAVGLFAFDYNGRIVWGQESKLDNDLTENEITLVCLAVRDKEKAKEILKETGLSIQNNILYRNNEETGTIDTNRS